MKADRVSVRITKGQKKASIALYAVGLLVLVAGIYGFLCGDMQAPFLSSVADQVYAARAAARNASTGLTGSVALFGSVSVPAPVISTVMNLAILLILAGLMLLYNAYMLRRQPWESMRDLFCIEPAVIFFILFVYYPLIDLVRISFTDMRMLAADPQAMVGLKNYEWLFLKSGFTFFANSLKVTGIYMLWEVFITICGGMLLALLFGGMTRLFGIMRTVVFMPKYIAVSTSAVVFIWILNGNHGIANYLLSCFGIAGPDWLNQESTALTGILFLTAWRVSGYAMMIYLSAMQGIPRDYYEAASIDGADKFHQFFRITVPMLAPTTLFLLVTTFIASMKVYESVDVMTAGGPGMATNVMVQWIYNLSFVDFRTARAAAVSVVFFLILLVFTAATMKYSNRNVNYDS